MLIIRVDVPQQNACRSWEAGSSQPCSAAVEEVSTRILPRQPLGSSPSPGDMMQGPPEGVMQGGSPTGDEALESEDDLLLTPDDEEYYFDELELPVIEGEDYDDENHRVIGGRRAIRLEISPRDIRTQVTQYK